MTGQRKIESKRASKVGSKVGHKYGEGSSKRRINSRRERLRYPKITI